MITDKLNNIDLYSEIPQVAKDFIKILTPDIEIGKVVLSDDIYANVETYITKFPSQGRFEAHDKYTDIQILLKGEEYIYVEDRSKLNVDIPYNKEKDITFYKDDIQKSGRVKLDGSNFALLYPCEAHAPQIAAGKKMQVKKVVVKVKA